MDHLHESALRKGDRRSFRIMRRILLATSVVSLFAAAACGESQSTAPAPAPQPGSPAPRDTANAGSASDAGVAAKEDLDAGNEWTGPWAGALFMSTPIMSDMEWPRPHDDDSAAAKKKREREGDARDKVVRIGYLRRGGKVPVLPEAHKKSNCEEGWYELVSGGFVCGKYASIDLNHPKYKSGPHAPDMNGPLPYQYGYNISNGTPLYRNVPSREERLQLEPWLNKKKAPKKDDDSTAASPSTTPAPVTPVTATADELLDGGIFLASQRLPALPDDPLAAPPVDAGVTPWYMRDWDGGKPQVTLDDLKGEGPLQRRMVKGFYLALDKEVVKGNTKWWQTTGGMLTPYDRIWLQNKWSEFHGTWLNESAKNDGARTDADKEKAQSADPKKPWPGVGFILWVHSKKWNVTTDKKHVTAGDPVSRFTIVKLTGENAVIGGLRYDETEEGWWMRANEGTHTNPGPPPTDLVAGERWVDVDLTTQTLVAFEGTTPVYATMVSTGKRNDDDKDKDHKTPPGSFRIREKHIAATMDGDVASDGPYSIEDVPWIMYFNGSYALHGAFWHGNWGHTQSHGCVNLSPLDAKAMFGWTEPRLPEGWHGVMSTTEKPGSRVIVHGESPK
jgi:hypothetical protein